jgi:hypothetical protein
VLASVALSCFGVLVGIGSANAESGSPAVLVSKSEIAIRSAAGTLPGYSGRAFFVSPGPARADVFAPCLPGEKAIAGGWSMLDKAAGPIDVIALDSHPAAASDASVQGWEQTLMNLSDVPLRVVVYASCASATVAGEFAVRTASGTVTPSLLAPNGILPTPFPFLASCAPGERVVAGGWAAPTELGVFTNVFGIDPEPVAPAGGPDTEGWRVNLFMLPLAGGPATGTVFATCLRADAAGKLSLRQAVGPGATRSGQGEIAGIGSHYAGCAAAEKVIAGGWSARQAAGFGPTVVNRDNGPTGRENFGVEAWNVILFNLTDAPADVTIYASCFG